MKEGARSTSNRARRPTSLDMVLEARVHQGLHHLVEPTSIRSCRLLVQASEENGVLLLAFQRLLQEVVAHVHELAQVRHHAIWHKFLASVFASGFDDVHLAQVVTQRSI